MDQETALKRMVEYTIYDQPYLKEGPAYIIDDKNIESLLETFKYLALDKNTRN